MIFQTFHDTAKHKLDKDVIFFCHLPQTLLAKQANQQNSNS